MVTLKLQLRSNSLSLVLVAREVVTASTISLIISLQLRFNFSNAEMGLCLTVKKAIHHAGVMLRLVLRSSSLSLLLLMRAFVRAAAMSSLMALQLRFSFSNTELGFFRNGQKACVTFISITTKFQSLDGIGVTQQHI